MDNLQRGIRVIVLIALFMCTISLFAQEATDEAEATEIVSEETTEAPTATLTPTQMPSPTATATLTATPTATATPIPTATDIPAVPVSVVGSGVVNPALQSIADASGANLDFNISTTGSSAGFEQFCAGLAEIATSIRPISVAEDTLCRDSGIEYFELLIGYDITVVVSNVEDNFLSCLTSSNMDAVFAPSATSSNWSEIALVDSSPTAPDAEATEEATEEPVALPDITLLVPLDSTLSYETLDNMVSGFGFRSDVQSLDAASIMDTVETTPGAIGVVPLEAALAPDANVFIVDLDLSGVGCIQASVESAEDDSYSAATPLYLYVARSAQDALAEFLDFLVSSGSVQAIIDAGYTPASANTYDLNVAILSGEASGRAATAEEITYEIPPGLGGNINIVGASSGFSIASNNASVLTSTQTGLTINNNFVGEGAGIETFCSGEADILFVNGDASAICDGNISYVSYDFGKQAVVLVANSGDSHTTCLTLQQINNIWSAASTNTVSQWSNVSDAFPEQNIVLVGVSAGNVMTDILMSRISEGAPPPARSDVAETNANPLYRAAAVANVPGALAYMSWVEYEEVVGSGQANTQLVAIDTGSGCVVPSLATIEDGSYPLTRQTTMIVKQSSLATPHVQSFIWTVFDDVNYSIIESLDFVGGFAAQDMIEFHTNLLAEFEEAEQVTAEATPEVTAEATAEVTEEAADE